MPCGHGGRVGYGTEPMIRRSWVWILAESIIVGALGKSYNPAPLPLLFLIFIYNSHFNCYCTRTRKTFGIKNWLLFFWDLYVPCYGIDAAGPLREIASIMKIWHFQGFSGIYLINSLLNGLFLNHNMYAYFYFFIIFCGWCIKLLLYLSWAVAMVNIFTWKTIHLHFYQLFLKS